MNKKYAALLCACFACGIAQDSSAMDETVERKSAFSPTRKSVPKYVEAYEKKLNSSVDDEKLFKDELADTEASDTEKTRETPKSKPTKKRVSRRQFFRNKRIELRAAKAAKKTEETRSSNEKLTTDETAAVLSATVGALEKTLAEGQKVFAEAARKETVELFCAYKKAIDENHAALRKDFNECSAKSKEHCDMVRDEFAKKADAVTVAALSATLAQQKAKNRRRKTNLRALEAAMNETREEDNKLALEWSDDSDAE